MYFTENQPRKNRNLSAVLLRMPAAALQEPPVGPNRNDVIARVLGATSLAMWLGAIGLWFQYDGTRPALPDRGAGRVYSLITHGHAVCLTFREEMSLDTLMVVGLTGGVVTMSIGLRTVRRWWGDSSFNSGGTMTWAPIDLAALQEMIQRDLAECSEQQRSFFARVAIQPEKWRQSPQGDDGGGFWAVAVYEDRVLWFNDIEDGFNVSTFTVRGEIPKGEYWCNQDPLQWALPRLSGDKSSRNSEVDEEA
jgi:hypothetical protein